jgi:hypothetical protein
MRFIMINVILNSDTYYDYNLKTISVNLHQTLHWIMRLGPEVVSELYTECSLIHSESDPES